MRRFNPAGAAVVVAAAVATTVPLTRAEVATLEQYLPQAQVDPGRVELGSDLRGALAGKKLEQVRPIADGVTLLFFADASESVTVLLASPEARGEHRLPSGPNLKFKTAAGEPVELGAILDEPVLYSVTDFGWGFVEYRMTLTPADPVDAVVTGADVDESAVRHTLSVEPGKLAAAFDEANALLAKGEGVKIELAPGLYRGGGLRVPSGDATLVIEGVGDEPAVITGADDWTGGWTAVDGAEGVYQKAWPNQWGLGVQNWERWNFLLAPGTSRSEVVAIDGVLLLPVDLELYRWNDPDGVVPLDQIDAGKPNVPGEWKLAGRRQPSELIPGTYGVDEANGLLYVCPPEGVDPNAASVEVATREELLRIEDRENVVLRNLEFRHGRGFVSGGYNVDVSGRNVLIEGCRFVENGSKALSIGRAPTNFTIRDSSFNGNGWKGLSGGYLAENLLVENVETSHNNWRGHGGGQHGWDAAGIKIFGVNAQVGIAIRGHRAFGNLTKGLWLDQSFTPTANVEISDGIYVGNVFGEDLDVEKLTGPVEVVRNVFWTDRPGTGIQGSSWNINLRDNILYAEGENRPLFLLHKRGTESEYAVHSRDWTLEDNLFVMENGADFLLQWSLPEQWADWLATLSASGNAYHVDDSPRPFIGREGGEVGLDAWLSITGESGDASLDPQFADPENYDWTITNRAVRDRLPDLPGPLSEEDREKLERALAESQRYLQIVQDSQLSGGPPFERATAAVDNSFRPLDLEPFANRPVVGQDSWIGSGNQLPQLKGGRNRFAGVPFDVLDPEGGQDVAISLKSQKMIDGVESVEIPVNGTAAAAYILHGAGWFDKNPDPVARYEFVYADGSTAGMDVVPEAPDAHDPHVGEWYYSYTPFDGEGARHVALQGDLGRPGAYLYVVELENPHPDREIASLRLAGDPSRDVSVYVLGVSLLGE